LFFKSWSWICAQNDIDGGLFHQLQDAIVSQLFCQDLTIFFKAMKDDAWIDYWDNTRGD